MNLPNVKTCSVDGCDRKHYGQGYCSMHHQRFTRTGDPMGTLRKGKPKPICRINNCDCPSVSLNLCSKHYQKFRKYGDPNKVVKIRNKCTVDSCNNECYGNGLCHLHYQRVKRTGTYLASSPTQKKCSVDGCDRNHYGHGLCQMHHRRKKAGIPMDVPKRIWVKAKSIEDVRWRCTPQGYVVGFLNSKQVFQHRVVWEQHHGRALQPFENIHHMNGRRDDNRIENLELWTKAQPCGQRPEDLVSWVVENYPELIQQHMKGKTNDKPARARQTRTGTNDKRRSTKRPAASRRPAQRTGRSR